MSMLQGYFPTEHYGAKLALTPSLLGEVVTVQVVKKFTLEPGEPVTPSYQQHVGFLNTYTISGSHIKITLDGAEQIVVDLHTHEVEVFHHI